MLETQTEVTYPELMEFLHTRGVKLSRSRWSYMLNGHRDVRKLDLIEALAEFFDVPVGYLEGTEGVPPRLRSRMPELQRLRRDRVRAYLVQELTAVEGPEHVSTMLGLLEEPADSSE